MKRLKDDLEKKQQLLCESQEKERRLKVKCDLLSRDFKHEKEEVFTCIELSCLFYSV